jgi:hypothetical protein
MKQSRFENISTLARTHRRKATAAVLAFALIPAAYAEEKFNMHSGIGGPDVALADGTMFSESFVTPANGTEVSGNFAITTNVNDAEGTVTSEEVFVDGVQVGNKLPNTPYYLDSTKIVNGGHAIGLQAIDNNGNTATAIEQVFVQNFPPDTQPPTETINSPTAGAQVSGDIQVVTAPFDNRHVAREEVFIDGHDQGAKSPTVPYGWNTYNFTNGSHTLDVKAFDDSGNEGDATESVNIHNTSPPIVIIPESIDQLKVNCKSGALDSVSDIEIQVQRKNRHKARIEVVTNSMPQDCLKVGHVAVKFMLSPRLQKKLGREYVVSNGKRRRANSFSLHDPIHPKQDLKAYYTNMAFQNKFPAAGHADLPDRSTATWYPNGGKPASRHNPSIASVIYR